MSQEGKHVAFFSDELNDSKRKYYVYDQEFYAIVQALKKWRHYLIPKEFVYILIIKLYSTWEVNIN